MDFKKYMEFRSDQDCPIGVIAFDLYNNPEIPLDKNEVEVLNQVDELFENTEVDENWQSLKSDYLSQKAV